MAGEGERSEVQRLVVECPIKALERIEAKRLDVEIRQEAMLRQTEVDTM